MIALAKSKPKPFDAIFVWKYSRFARNREDSVVYKSMLRKQCGIDVISISEAVGDDKMSVLFEAMIEAMDEYYSINLSEEVKRGMTEKAKRGGVLSIPPFGYKVEKGQFEIIEEEAEIIKDVFKNYLAGSGFLTLSKKLNTLGIKTHRGKKIETRTIEYWLNNPAYIGKTRWNPYGKTSRDYYNKNIIITDGSHKPIIDSNLWNSVQQKLQENKKRYKSRMRSPQKEMSYWLNGILRCGKCGSTLVNCSGYYYCGKKGKGLCEGNGGISIKNITKIVIDKLEEILDADDILISFDSTSNIEDDVISTNTTHLIEAKIEESNRKLIRFKDAYENGIDTIAEYKENKAKALKEIDDLKKLLEEEKNINPEPDLKSKINENSKLKENIKKISDLLKSENVPNEVKNDVLRSIVKEIVKTGDDGKTFNIVFWSLI